MVNPSVGRGRQEDRERRGVTAGQEQPAAFGDGQGTGEREADSVRSIATAALSSIIAHADRTRPSVPPRASTKRSAPATCSSESVIGMATTMSPSVLWAVRRAIAACVGSSGGVGPSPYTSCPELSYTLIGDGASDSAAIAAIWSALIDTAAEQQALSTLVTSLTP
jgi:hypothetical protein